MCGNCKCLDLVVHYIQVLYIDDYLVVVHVQPGCVSMTESVRGVKIRKCLIERCVKSRIISLSLFICIAYML